MSGENLAESPRLEARQMEADQRKDLFIAALAHEIGNQLAPIQSCVETMLALHMEVPCLIDMLDIVQRQVNHIGHLVQDLLESSRINQEKYRVSLQPVSLNDILLEAIKSCHRSLFTDNRHVFVDIAPSSLMVMADAGRLAQVFSNIFSNACKYTSPGGRIWISAGADASQAIVSVRDNGIGICPAALDCLFNLFMRVNAVNETGLGIGLPLARKLLELQGGTIEARSAGVGRGSEFVVTLPLLRP